MVSATALMFLVPSGSWPERLLCAIRPRICWLLSWKAEREAVAAAGYRKMIGVSAKARRCSGDRMLDGWEATA